MSGSAKARARGRVVRFLTPDDPGSAVLNHLRDRSSFEDVTLSHVMTEAEIRADERERIAAMVESLPTMVWVGVDDPAPFRARTPAEIAAEIRRSA